MSSITFQPGDENWKKLRRLATQPIPGKHSALYWLNANILGKAPLIPMTPKAHLGMCLFAEGATGIPEIDSARVKLILVSRGIGKSSLVTKGLPILKILQDRNYAIGIGNEIADLAKTFLGDIKAEFESNELLRALFPEVIPNFRETVWAADRIIVQRDKLNPTSPSVLATGVGGTVTGVHMNMWIVDDMLSQNAAEAAYRGNFSEIEATNRWFKRLQPLLKSPKRDPIVFIGTRWWEGDSYEEVIRYWGGNAPREEFIWTLKLPAYKHEFEGKIYDHPPDTQQLKLFRQGEIAVFKLPAIDEAGRPIFPERYDEEELQSLQAQDPVFFAGQYLLEPTAGAASEFNAEWLHYYEIEGTRIRYRDQLGKPNYVPIRDLHILVSVDPAFADKHTAARTAIPVIGTDGKNLFLLEDFAEHGMSEDDIAHKVLDFHFRYQPKKLFVETIVAQVAVANAIRRIFRDNGLPEPMIEEIKSHGSQKKVMRIYGLQSYFKRGQFHIHKSHTRFLHEYATFPRGQLRDLLDAISFQVEEWERIFRMGSAGQSPLLTPRGRQQADQAALARIQRAFKRRR